jgi:hypothetical protein
MFIKIINVISCNIIQYSLRNKDAHDRNHHEKMCLCSCWNPLHYVCRIALLVWSALGKERISCQDNRCLIPKILKNPALPEFEIGSLPRQQITGWILLHWKMQTLCRDLCFVGYNCNNVSSQESTIKLKCTLFKNASFLYTTVDGHISQWLGVSHLERRREHVPRSIRHYWETLFKTQHFCRPPLV